MEQNGNRFHRAVKAFAAEHGVPVLRLNKPDRTRWDDRKLDHVRPYLQRAEREGRYGVGHRVCAGVPVGVRRQEPLGHPGSGQLRLYAFVKEDRRVGTYYFYVLDRDFGPGFIKICVLPLSGEGVGLTRPSP